MRRRVKKTIVTIGAVALVSAGAGLGVARAASPEQQGADAGGTYSTSGGTATCSFAGGMSDKTIARGEAPAVRRPKGRGAPGARVGGL